MGQMPISHSSSQVVSFLPWFCTWRPCFRGAIQKIGTSRDKRSECTTPLPGVASYRSGRTQSPPHAATGLASRRPTPGVIQIVVGPDVRIDVFVRFHANLWLLSISMLEDILQKPESRKQ